jgi:uncharacterized repeat protein (TIGR03803 family)
MTSTKWIAVTALSALLCACGGGGSSGGTSGGTSSGTGSTTQPQPAAHSVGGSVAGLAAGTHLVLLYNGAQPMSISGNGTFAFPSGATGAYTITVGTQPTAETCSVTGGTGTMGSANNATIVVTCATESYTVGGSISGLSTGGLVLANSTDTLSVPAGAQTFAMPTPVLYGSNYAITVQTQPASLTCTVVNGSGPMGAGAVTSVAITCAASTHTVGGTISGLGSGTGLVLANGNDVLDVPAGSTTFTMHDAVANNASYDITVQAAPVLTSCSVANGSGPVSGADVSNVDVSCAASNAESVLYTFQAAPDGNGPQFGNLVQDSQGNLYGATGSGGAYSRGTVYQLSPSGSGWTESILWSFGATSADAAYPEGGLLLGADGNLYGAGNAGGANGSGAVFKLARSGSGWAETVVWSLGGAGDGTYPYSSLIQDGQGNLYGTTISGGTIGTYGANGTVYELSPSTTAPSGWTESVLWTFRTADLYDGSEPYGNLLLGSDGQLYGTTLSGGAGNRGTVFELAPPATVGGAWTETILVSFSNTGTGPMEPFGGLIQDAVGNLYGTTEAGGVNGAGTVFELVPSGSSWNQLVLWSFGGAGDGGNPWGNLLLANDGNLYGTTDRGGMNNLGTVFQLTPSGTETVVWSFGGTADVKYATCTLIQGRDGGLYGFAEGSVASGTYGGVFVIR